MAQTRFQKAGALSARGDTPVAAFLRQHFVTTDREFVEGAVDVFVQNLPEIEAGEHATLAITALGVYEAQIDGHKVGNEFLTPGYTYYPRDLAYQTFDITNLLVMPAVGCGSHRLTVFLGQGWYAGRFTFNNKTCLYGTTPAVSWMVETTAADGTRRRFFSDPHSIRTVTSPYEYAGLYDGERYVAKGANVPIAAIRRPHHVCSFTGPLPATIEPERIAITVQEERQPVSVTRHGQATICDFGQNFAGIVSIDPTRMEGTRMTVRHGEILTKDGELYTANLRKAKQTIVYTKGTEKEPYTPRFSYMGFRYIEITGTPWREGLVTAHVVSADLRRTGRFECGNKDVNRLFSNILWGQRSNYEHVPTDCPQRDERMGYTGDAHVFALTGAFNYDTRTYLEKFLSDIRFSQMDNREGYVSSTVPATGPAGIGFLTMIGWGNADIILPWMLWWQYGDLQIIRTQWASMTRFVDCEIRHMNHRGLWRSINLGDWLTLGRDIKWMATHNGPVSNAFIVHDLDLMGKMARLLGKSDEAARYHRLFLRSRQGYIDTYVKEDGAFSPDYQGALVMGLAFVIPKGPLWNRCFAHLVGLVRQEGLGTGFFATEHLLPLLAANGQGSLAYNLLLNRHCPGWMYEIDKGATTIWERWDALRPDGSVNESKSGKDNMVSFNHYAFGSVGEFLYRFVLGIQPLEPGYRKILVAPVIDPRLRWARGSYNSVVGKIAVAWRAEGDTWDLSVSTPTDGQVVLPSGEKQPLTQGEHTFHGSLPVTRRHLAGSTKPSSLP